LFAAVVFLPFISSLVQGRPDCGRPDDLADDGWRHRRLNRRRRLVSRTGRYKLLVTIRPHAAALKFRMLGLEVPKPAERDRQ